MSSVYGVEPQLEQTACIVDLLDRAGMVEEAENFIEEKMGGLGGGDANIWGALLGCCRTNVNVEIGNRVWKKLAEMGISDCGVHIVSYNMFREAGLDMEAKRVRKLISEAGMKKKLGCSMIEVDGLVKKFLAGDLSHPYALGGVYRTLELLLKIMDFGGNLMWNADLFGELLNFLFLECYRLSLRFIYACF
ncbi:PREDICTED: putative pentatricopeptide repeat-containing protein At5g59200, chloroplastic [Theobroma cacao]|uniref:Pentatricopeptide repeat-containing protein At5g59200, chloroplastic n=1 Tax=Theobroma cacao TaxID=3641 RepID=A0AB32WS22_THECC|nr:PREDICTED: putative pentatricopeptide repeat-containing protein At5g59200, chloroplastic [Theobroma cacao]